MAPRRVLPPGPVPVNGANKSANHRYLQQHTTSTTCQVQPATPYILPFALVFVLCLLAVCADMIGCVHSWLFMLCIFCQGYAASFSFNASSLRLPSLQQCLSSFPAFVVIIFC